MTFEAEQLGGSGTELASLLRDLRKRAGLSPEYVRASLAHSTADTSQAVGGKLGRQAVLYDASKRFTFVLTEQAVRWPVVAPLALAEQMDRLASLSYLPNVQIGVIPTGTPTPRTPLSTFTAYDAALVTIETTAGSLVLRDGRDVQAYLKEFAGYEDSALFGEDLRARLAEWSAACRARLQSTTRLKRHPVRVPGDHPSASEKSGGRTDEHSQNDDGRAGTHDPSLCAARPCAGLS
ncbi:Scr1 family TA system antitoxin-like transcriptional regulator [Streptomyces lavendulae]|uniref:Scr1 family TA system antitoxin-like transcriptional regulator n=1 Tax=Streptomyces lavendulae TaxID=1914 RepID=UPI0033FF5F8A